MDQISLVAKWLVESNSTVAFTGAGISTESGIPDFRSPGGVWSTSKPVYYDEFLKSAAARYEYWRQKAIAHRDFADSQPNVGHRTLAKWEATGRVEGLITQNIDGLHQIAGSQTVIELHGTARSIACLDCGTCFGADEMVTKFLASDEIPHCTQCGGITKHATISFGQSLSSSVLQAATELTQSAELYLAMGSSLVVEPAASLPRLAASMGAKLVIINRDPTPLDSSADVKINTSLGEALHQIDQVLPA